MDERIEKGGGSYMKRRLWKILMLSIITICSVTVGAVAAQPPSDAQQDRLDAVYVNGTELKSYLEQHPGMGYVYIDDNVRTMVPLRAFAIQWTRRRYTSMGAPMFPSAF